MPPIVVIPDNSAAVSVAVYYFGISNVSGTNRLSVVPTRGDLAAIVGMLNNDVCIVKQGIAPDTYDIAIYDSSLPDWVIKSTAGPKGDTGATGPAGAASTVPGPTGPAGRDGVDGEAGLPPVHRWVGTSLQFKNPDGTWGTAVDLLGATWLGGGAAAPNDVTDGRDGDFWLQATTGKVYKKVSGAWGTPIMNIIGPPGATGATGPSGGSTKVAIPITAVSSYAYTHDSVSVTTYGVKPEFQVYLDDGTGDIRLTAVPIVEDNSGPDPVYQFDFGGVSTGFIILS